MEILFLKRIKLILCYGNLAFFDIKFYFMDKVLKITVNSSFKNKFSFIKQRVR